MKKCCVAIVVLVVVLGFATVKANEGQEACFEEKPRSEESVSIIELIANPEDYRQKDISVSGFVLIRSDYESSLYLGQEDFRAGLTANTIAVDLETASTLSRERLEAMNESYVTVAGQFRLGGSVFSGGRVVDIYCVMPVPSR